jgi:hypothetical protein
LVLATFALNLLMTASLQLLWGLLNVMQLILVMPLLNLTFTMNAVTFYKCLSDIANFDFLPSEVILSWVFAFTEIE